MAPSVTTYIDKSRGTWYVNVYWPGPPARRLRKNLGVPATQDPSSALADWVELVLPAIEARATATQPRVPRSQGPLLRELAVWYLETHLAVKGASPRTAERYAPCIWHFVNFMSTRHVTRTSQLSTRLIEEWQIQGQRDKSKDRPVRNDIIHLRRWLHACESAHECPLLPPIKWNVPRKTRATQHSAYDRSVIDAWLNGLSAWRPLVGLVARWVAATGWRIADVLDFRVGEFDRARGRIDRAQLKTDTNLPYPLTPTLLAIIDEAMTYHRLSVSDHVFIDTKRRPWTYKAIYRCIENYHATHWAGEPITFRDLRKSFATNLAMQGCPPNVLKELMGHSDIKMALGYYVDVDIDRMAEWCQRVSAVSAVPESHANLITFPVSAKKKPRASR